MRVRWTASPLSGDDLEGAREAGTEHVLYSHVEQARRLEFVDGDDHRGLVEPHQPRDLALSVLAAQGEIVEALLHALDVTRFDFANVLRSQTAFAPHFKGVLPAYSADLSQGYERYATWMGEGDGILGELQGLRTEIQSTRGPLKYRALSRSRADLDQMMAWRDEPMEPWAQPMAPARRKANRTGICLMLSPE